MNALLFAFGLPAAHQSENEDQFNNQFSTNMVVSKQHLRMKKTETIYVLPAMGLQEIENNYREKKHVLLSYLLINNTTPIFVVTAFAVHSLLVVAKLVTCLSMVERMQANFSMAPKNFPEKASSETIAGV